MNKPLSMKSVIVTRAVDQAEELIAKLCQVGAEVIHIPTIEIVAPDSWEKCDHAIANLESYDWLVFSSTNGVQFFLSRLKEKTSLAVLNSKKIAAVGEKTQQVLKKMGLHVDLVPDEYKAEGLIKAFEGENIAGKKILIPTVQKGREILTNHLLAMGASVDAIAVYKNRIPKKENIQFDLNGQSIDVLTFTSPSTFNNFIEIFGIERLKKWVHHGSRLAAIGSVTAAAIGDAGFSTHILPKKSTVDNLVSSIIEHFS